MGKLTRGVKERLEQAGFLVKRISAGQVIPAHVDHPELYARPEDYNRLLKAWRSSDLDQVFTPEVVDNTMLSRMKLYYLYKFFRQSLGIPGDVFEAGSGSGGSSRLMLNSLLEAKVPKQMWLLDTFEGYQKVDAEKDGAHVKVNQCRCESKEYVERLLRNDSVLVHVIKGLIPGTLAQVKADKICFAHIDVNLHEPTFAATNFVLERMSPGGIVVFDDYGWPATYGARQAIDEISRKHWQQVIALAEQAFLIKQ